MLTAFGKICRKLRIDHNELMKDMADKLGVTSSFISAVEMGKKSIPLEWPNRIADMYQLSQDQRIELVRAAEFSKSSINVDNMDDGEKQLMFALARKVDGLSQEDKNQLFSILKIEK